MVIWEVNMPFIENKYCFTQWISYRSGGHSKYICLQNEVNFHRFEAWKIVLIFKTAFILT